MTLDRALSQIMETEVLTVDVSQPLSAARQVMIDHGLHHVPVLDGEQLVGMISSTDLLALGFGERVDPGSDIEKIIDARYPIAEVMETGLVTIGARRTLADAARMLATGSFHSLPVVDGSGNLVGIVTSTDLIEQLCEILRGSDEEE